MSKWAKRVLSVLLACVMVGGFVPMALAAQLTASETNYGSNGKFIAPIDPPVAGSIPISNRAQLEAISDNLSGSYHLTADIDLSGAEWMPMGNADTPFTGTFDGQGHVVKNMKITGEGYELNGLFGYVWVGFIKNLGLENTYIDVTRSSSSFEPSHGTKDIYAGGVCGYSNNYIFGTGYRDCYINNCYNIGYISIRSTSNVRAYGGGIRGGGGGDIIKCYNAGEVDVSAVSASSAQAVAVAGGIAGVGTGVNNCYNISKVSAYCSTNYSSSRDVEARAGGIAGVGIIEYCYNAGEVCASAISPRYNFTHVGGITGLGDASKCYNVGTVTASNSGTAPTARIGGICGQGTADSCYNMGAISVTVSGSDYYQAVGGICGFGDASNSYNTGSVSVSGASVFWVGGICGDYATVINGYAPNLYGSEYGTQLTAAQMKNKASFVGFDFTNVWDIDPAVNDGYPFLRNMPVLEGGGADTDYGDIIPFAPSITWKDSYFSKNPTVYDDELHQLATIAAKLSNDAYGDAPGDENGYSGVKIKNALGALNFNITDDKFFQQGHYKYMGVGDENYPDIVGYSIAHKEINIVENGSPKKCNLIAVVVRGTPPTKEWHSNFDIGYDDVPNGFNNAEQELYNQLCDFLISAGLTNNANNKFLITGHSRGAAVANLLAARINRTQIYCLRKNLFAYTFATPNTIKKHALKAEENYYPGANNNIFNFVNAEDFVPYLPLSKSGWDFWKYGRTFAFPSKGLSSDYSSKYKPQLATMMEGNYSDYGFGNVQKIVDELHDLASGIYGFYNNSYACKTALAVKMVTPENFFNALCDIQAGTNMDAALDFMWDLRVSSRPSKYMYLASFFMINPFEGYLAVNPQVGKAHDSKLYYTWMRATNSDSLKTNINSYYARIACPVDVEVYDSKGSLAGKVVNSIVDNTIKGDIDIIIDDDVKHIYLPAHDNYTFKLLGTAEGTMNYTVESINVTEASVTEQKEFRNVTLSAGKTMVSTVGDTIGTPNVQLFVTDGEGTPIATVHTDGTETPVNQTNPKQYFKLWGKVTKWEKTFWNWLLLILCFGWIWMAF